MTKTEITVLIILSAICGYVLMHFIFRFGKKWQERKEAKKRGE